MRDLWKADAARCGGKCSGRGDASGMHDQRKADAVRYVSEDGEM